MSNHTFTGHRTPRPSTFGLILVKQLLLLLLHDHGSC
jgi:hypothetical protein